jgi:hypothetical protein
MYYILYCVHRIHTPASTFAGLEQLGSANNEIIETKTPIIFYFVQG